MQSLGAVDRRVRGVAVIRGRGGAEDALAVLGPGDVLDAPRCPQRPLGHDGAAYRRQRASLRSCSTSSCASSRIRPARSTSRARSSTSASSAPWLAGEAIELNEYRWLPDRATLTIYEAPGLAVADMGLGRGWQNVTRSGRDVTQEVLIEARDDDGRMPTADDFKAEIAARSARRRDLDLRAWWSSPASGIRSRA